MKEMIRQQLEVQDWPLTKPGDAKFFGYVVALGVFVKDWCAEDGMIPYVDFAYNDRYTRYRLPADESLKKQLHAFLWNNIHDETGTGGVDSKVWIELSASGYSVDLP